jgi:hypothetical protein
MWALLASLAQKILLFDLNCFPQTGVSRVVIATPLAEGFPTAPHAAIRTDRGTAVSTLRNRTIAARCACVSVAIHMFDLAIGVHAAFIWANSANNSRMRLPAHSNS